MCIIHILNPYGYKQTLHFSWEAADTSFFLGGRKSFVLGPCRDKHPLSSSSPSEIRWTKHANTLPGTPCFISDMPASPAHIPLPWLGAQPDLGRRGLPGPGSWLHNSTVLTSLLGPTNTMPLLASYLEHVKFKVQFFIFF